MATLVFDSAPLNCFARAEQLTLLERLTRGDERVTTRAVLAELQAGERDHPKLGDVRGLQWLRVEPVDSLEELRLFAEYARRLSAGKHNIGESSVLAWAEAHNAIAFTDDQVAVQIAKERKVQVMRTLALVARGVRRRDLSEADAHMLADELLRAGARFPFSAGGFTLWAKEWDLF